MKLLYLFLYPTNRLSVTDNKMSATIHNDIEFYTDENEKSACYNGKNAIFERTIWAFRFPRVFKKMIS